jgi:hypothetical protein
LSVWPPLSASTVTSLGHGHLRGQPGLVLPQLATGDERGQQPGRAFLQRGLGRRVDKVGAHACSRPSAALSSSTASPLEGLMRIWQ